MKKHSVVIIDDEKKSREVLQKMLEAFCPDVQILGEADNVTTGVEIVKALQPEILFLDIEMRSGTGFDLLQQIDNSDFEVIFTTAYEEYAIKALRLGAIDYLLKPIDITELKNAIAKAVQKKEKDSGNQNLVDLIRNIKNDRKHRISLSTLEGVFYVDIDQIIRCEASGAYTTFHLKNKTKVVTSKNLKEYELLLAEHNFFRVHHSHIINIDEVFMYIKSDGVVEMKDGSQVSISGQKKDAFLERMKSTG